MGPRQGCIRSKKVNKVGDNGSGGKERQRRKGRREETKVSLGTRRPRACFLEGMVRY